MQFQKPKNDTHFIWTKHVIEKMQYYQLSPSRVKRLITKYERQEQGIAKNTIALGRRLRTKRACEMWVMLQTYGKRIKIISAWRYPGISPKYKGAPIPKSIIEELQNGKERCY